MVVKFDAAATFTVSTGSNADEEIKKSTSFIGRALSIGSRAKQYAMGAAKVDAKHAKKAVGGPTSPSIFANLSFGSRAKKYQGVAENASAAVVELSELL